MIGQFSIMQKGLNCSNWSFSFYTPNVWSVLIIQLVQISSMQRYANHLVNRMPDNTINKQKLIIIAANAFHLI